MVDVERGHAGATTPTGTSFDVEVRLFASVREAVGRERITVTLASGATAGDLLSELARTHPGIARHGRSLAVAVNLAVVGPTHALRAGDEVALLPPVGGG